MTEITGKLSSAFADRYRIESHLGEGGMATVYLAHDLKHDRKVAIKVLKPDLAAVIGGDRFIQEIKVTANLQHPNILPLYDSGAADSFLYYVMPYVEGESLRDKLDREKQFAVAEAVKIAESVASALDYAHRHDVIHRDIKPENLLLHDGQAMVADFGIALAISAAAGNRLTETGLSVGTPHYMSPEQASADRELDGRTDVYSLAATLYEMLVGEPPFTGPSAQGIVAKILTVDPTPVTQERHSVPVHVAAAVQKALAKLPADRFATAAEFGQALSTPTSTLSTLEATAVSVAATGPRAADWVKRGALAVAAAMTVVAAAGWLRPEPARNVTRARVSLWHGGLTLALPYVAAVAPDGSSIVYVDSTLDGSQLFHKARDQADGEPIAGTAGGFAPFFSPGGEWVAYFEGGRLRKMPSGGGGSITLTSDANTQAPTGAWLDDETIVYVDRAFNLRRVAAAGGESTALYDAIGQANRGAVYVTPLPDARGVLFSGCTAGCVQSDLYVVDVVADSAWVLVEDAIAGWHLPSGHIFYSGIEGGGYVAPFELGSMSLTGGAIPALDGLRVSDFVVSRSGTALYVRGTATRNAGDLVLVDRSGAERLVAPEWTGQFSEPSLTSDGRTFAVSVTEAGVEEIWTRAVDRGPQSKITFGPGRSFRPAWTSDGQTVSYISETPDNRVSARSADGSGQETTVIDLVLRIQEVEYTADGEWIVFRVQDASSDLYAKRLDQDSEPVKLFESDFNEREPAVSPDGRWLAFISDLSGQMEVFVSPFPNTNEGRWTVSINGGQEPAWSRDSRELFFKSRGMLMTAAVPPGEVFRNEAPQPLFSTIPYANSLFHRFYDVTPGGEFLMIRNRGGAGGDGELILVENWFGELKERLGN